MVPQVNYYIDLEEREAIKIAWVNLVKLDQYLIQTSALQGTTFLVAMASGNE